MNIPEDIMFEIIKYLDGKSAIRLYTTTTQLYNQCNDKYWKILYNICYNNKYYGSKEYKLTEHKKPKIYGDTITLQRKYTNKEYVKIYCITQRLNKKTNNKRRVCDIYNPTGKINIFYPEISELFHITRLDLNKCLIGYVPSSIGNMTNLKELCLSNTNISMLPKEIGLLTKLKTLYLMQNTITSLPEEIGLLTKLTYLDCTFNKLTSLPKEFEQLTQLKRLYLNNNQLSSLPNMVFLVKLKDISLENNNLFKEDIYTITSTKLYPDTRRMLDTFPPYPK